jgi:putative ABC transport system ATP-binding protein
MRIVEVTNLKVSYALDGESLTVLDIPAWSVEAGEQIALFGPSGCGKSTLLHVVAGLLVPNHGNVSVCGRRLTEMGEAERDRFRARHVGYIFQSFNLLQGYTALENVLMGMAFSPEKPDRHLAKALLEEVGLAHRMKHYPAQMSIGEQQRVAIARALAKKPELILADEPTGSLDPTRSADIVASLLAACRKHGCSLLLVSHEKDVIEAFEKRVSFMDLNRAFATKEAHA